MNKVIIKPTKDEVLSEAHRVVHADYPSSNGEHAALMWEIEPKHRTSGPVFDGLCVIVWPKPYMWHFLNLCDELWVYAVVGNAGVIRDAVDLAKQHGVRVESTVTP